MYMLDFGERLRALRKEKGYTQKVIAEKMNVSQNTVVRWENNYKFPTQNNLIQLSEYSMYHWTISLGSNENEQLW